MPQTNKQKFYKLHNIPATESLSLPEIAKYAKMPVEALEESYMRGAGAWITSLGSVRLKRDFSKNPDTKRYPRSTRLSQKQWGFGRLFAFVMKTKKVFYGSDRDIAEKYKLL